MYNHYTAITFSPVQGFIEKSRKLRDLFGASLILSFLSQRLIQAAMTSQEVEGIISPGLINIAQGMPNRILLKGRFSHQQVKQTLINEWKQVLKYCREWIETRIPNTYHWKQEWQMWGTHSWEVFWGEGETIQKVMENLENNKLCRDWTGLNWIGESSSLTGTDAIAWPGLGSEERNPKLLRYQNEKEHMDQFYRHLSLVLEGKNLSDEPEGKFLDPYERLNIPELVKRLVTRQDIASAIGMPTLNEGFTDIVRKAEPNTQTPGQWTGWFMGDGDRVGRKLKEIADNQGEEGLRTFSQALRNWGESFKANFPQNLGRIIYAGGDDFLGVIYSQNSNKSILPARALEWLMGLKQEWQTHQQNITLSVGFVWAAGSVPQRDILQHCREAEKRAKALGRDRVTIRVVFNSGQYVQWTCPWDQLNILNEYKDRDKGKNWSHIYQDLAQLKARHAITCQPQNKLAEYSLATSLINIYFNNQGETLSKNRREIVGDITAEAFVSWIDDLVHVGWQLCS